MNDVTKHTLLAGLTDVEIAEVVGREMGRRDFVGILFFYSPYDQHKNAVSFTLVDKTMETDVIRLPLHQQLKCFSIVAQDFGVKSDTLLEDFQADGGRG